MVILLLVILLTQQDKTDLFHIRKEYAIAANDKNTAQQLLKKLEKKSDTNPILIGYHGAVMMVMAQYHLNPLSKLSSFKSGKLKLEDALKQSPNDVELRYLRFTIQYHSPVFLDYQKHLQQDKSFLINSLSDIKDADLRGRVAGFLSSTNLLTTQEKAKVNHYLI